MKAPHRAVCLLVATLEIATVAAAPPLDRIDRVDHWLVAVLHHQPGTLDAAALDIASWSDDRLRALGIDLNNLIALMRDPSGRALGVVDRQGRAKGSFYTEQQTNRLLALACAAGGIVLSDPACVSRKSEEQLGPELRQLAMLARDGRGVGADNYVLKRGALLHSDIATLAPESMNTMGPPSAGRHRIAVETSDGRTNGIFDLGLHWDIARRLLDAVRSTRLDRPAPSQDAMVHDWYVASAAWMQYHRQYDLVHLRRAQVLFPDDAEILFLGATQHETYASRRVQAVVQTTVLPRGYSLEPQSSREEQRQAETLLRRAIAVNPGFGEAHLRLGRLLGLDAQYADAERELMLALERLGDPEDRYFVQLFLGRIQEATRQYDAARATFTRAAGLFPDAQSPWIALAELAVRRGDREAAMQAMARVSALPSNDDWSDPWWEYHVWQARDADRRMDAVLRPFVLQPVQPVDRALQGPGRVENRFVRSNRSTIGGPGAIRKDRVGQDQHGAVAQRVRSVGGRQAASRHAKAPSVGSLPEGDSDRLTRAGGQFVGKHRRSRIAPHEPVGARGLCEHRTGEFRGSADVLEVGARSAGIDEIAGEAIS